MTVDLVSEGIDRLLRQMTDVATGESEYERARQAFYAEVQKSKNDTEAWWKAIVAAGGLQIEKGGYYDQKLYTAAESISNIGVDFMRATKDPEDYVPDAIELYRTAVWQGFKETGLSEMAARRLLDLWEEYYRNLQLEEAHGGQETGGFVQIGGDFGDAWVYGGTWYSKANDQLIHIDGLDGNGITDVEASDPKVDKRLTPADYDRIAKDLNAENDEHWEGAEDTIRLEYASVVNDERQMPYFRVGGESDQTIENDWADDIVEIKAQFDNGEELWAKMPPAQKLAALADHKGWHEFDYYAEKATKAELSEILGGIKL